MAATYSVRLDLDGDGTPETEIKSYTLGVNIRRGRSAELAAMDMGTATLTLNNHDGRFNPVYASGAYFGTLDLYAKMDVRATLDSGTIGIGTPTTAASIGAGATLTFSHTVSAGDNRLLLVRIAVRSEVGAAQQVSGVTFNGDPLTMAGRSTATVGVSTEIWYRIAPDVATGDVIVTLAASEQGIVAEALNLTNVDQDTPIGAFASYNNAGDNAPTVEAASATGEIVFDALGTYDSPTVAATTVGAGQTQDSNLTEPGSTGQVRLSTSHENGAASVTMSWSTSSTPIVALAAVPVKPSTTYSLFTGYITSFTPNIPEHEMVIECADLFMFLRAYHLNLALTADDLTGTRIADILTEFDATVAGAADLDAGQTILPTSYWRNTDALTALQECADHDLGGVIFIAGDGVFTFRDRHARALATSIGTITRMQGLSLTRSGDDVYTKAILQGGGHEPGIAGSSIYIHSPLPVLLAQGATLPINPNYNQPASNVITPVEGTDYIANVAADGSGTDLSADMVSTFENFSGGASWTIRNDSPNDVYLTTLQIRGTPLGLPTSLRAASATAASSVSPFDKTYESHYRFHDDLDELEAFADYIVSHFNEPHPAVTLTLYPHGNDSDAQLTIMLNAELNDRVTVTDNTFAWSSQINEDFFIESIQHTIDPTVHAHETVFLCTTFTADSFFVLNVSELNGEDVLGYV